MCFLVILNVLFSLECIVDRGEVSLYFPVFAGIKEYYNLIKLNSMCFYFWKVYTNGSLCPQVVFFIIILNNNYFLIEIVNLIFHVRTWFSNSDFSRSKNLALKVFVTLFPEWSLVLYVTARWMPRGCPAVGKSKVVWWGNWPRDSLGATTTVRVRLPYTTIHI